MTAASATGAPTVNSTSSLPMARRSLESDDDNGSFGGQSSSIAGATIPVTGTYYLRVSTTSDQPTAPLRSLGPGAERRTDGRNRTQRRHSRPAAPRVRVGQRRAQLDDRRGLLRLNLNAGDSVVSQPGPRPRTRRRRVERPARAGPVRQPRHHPGSSTMTGAATPDSEALFLTVKDAGTYTSSSASRREGRRSAPIISASACCRPRRRRARLTPAPTSPRTIPTDPVWSPRPSPSPTTSALAS